MSSDYDQKVLFDLLQPYRSEECRRARRNLSFIAFTVVTSQIVGLSVRDIKPFGIDLSLASVPITTTLGISVLLYWVFLFVVALIHDREMQKERLLILDSTLESKRNRLEAIRDFMQKNPGATHPHFAEVTAFLDAYEKQVTRLSRASLTGKLVEWFEFFVPVLLAISALCVMLWNLYWALYPTCA